MDWSWVMSFAVAALSLPIHLVSRCFAVSANVLLFIFSPAIAFGAYMLSVAESIVMMIIGLQPLYTFFAYAAFIGIVSGIILTLTSRTITFVLGMSGPDRPASEPVSTDDYYYSEQSTGIDANTKGINGKTQSKNGNRTPDTPPLDAVRNAALRLKLEDSSSETDWQSLDTTPRPGMRPNEHGLLSQTIHEEDDESQ